MSKYSKENLARVVASSSNLTEVCRKLGMTASGGARMVVARKIQEHGLDTSHFKKQAKYIYSRELLAEAAAASTSVSEVVRRLGIPQVGGWTTHISRQLKKFDIDTSHFKVPLQKGIQAPQIVDIPTTRLREAVANSRSYADVFRYLGLPVTSTAYAQIKRVIAEHDLDTSHFFAYGAGRSPSRLRPEDILILKAPGGRRTPAPLLRRALQEIGRPYLCATCGITDWNGQPLILEVDHINGKYWDNRPDNLRFLCPNCHSQTSTYCGKKLRVAR
ncbi:HNH endonuclease signature motif containing protein [Carbonactinospora thermoautotrophica]|uniref:HNH endonuclease signature motif containing protein n=1 Tax=Carbonactinospora thermoautotrophica TaxID=1469144 RepID=UPI00082B1AB1|nr:HNH endonuclease signature motif containing protein [Carbonactinospora thermoautotrophica]